MRNIDIYGEKVYKSLAFSLDKQLYRAGEDLMIDAKRTGRRIKEACDSQGITVKQIQRELNIGSFQSIYNWFQGKTLPTLDNLYALSKLLGVSMESMIVEQSEYRDYKVTMCIEDYNLHMMARLSECSGYYIKLHKRIAQG